jgi:hypothetical protein
MNQEPVIVPHTIVVQERSIKNFAMSGNAPPFFFELKPINSATPRINKPYAASPKIMAKKILKKTRYEGLMSNSL